MHSIVPQDTYTEIPIHSVQLSVLDFIIHLLNKILVAIVCADDSDDDGVIKSAPPKWLNYAGLAECVGFCY